jgi:hypothetical protein
MIPSSLTYSTPPTALNVAAITVVGNPITIHEVWKCMSEQSTAILPAERLLAMVHGEGIDEIEWTSSKIRLHFRKCLRAKCLRGYRRIT